jgi:hypothetical protein
LRAVLEAPGLVAGLDDFAVMCQPIQQGGGHLGVAEDGRPFAERQIGGDDDRSSLIELGDQVEQQLSTGLGERQIAEFVEDNKVEPGEMIGNASLSSRARFRLQPIDQVDDIEEATSGAVADQGASDRDGQM